MAEADGWYMCRVGFVEAFRAVALAAGRSATRGLKREWPAFGIVEVDQSLVEHAAALAIKRDLQRPDALHLAAALVLPSEEVMVATWDRRLHTAAEAEGLRLLPRRSRDTVLRGAHGPPGPRQLRYGAGDGAARASCDGACASCDGARARGGAWRGDALVGVVVVPPAVGRRLRPALRRGLPLLLAPERRDVEVVPRASHLLVAGWPGRPGPRSGTPSRRPSTACAGARRRARRAPG
jgi:hypothetical protein